MSDEKLKQEYSANCSVQFFILSAEGIAGLTQSSFQQHRSSPPCWRVKAVWVSNSTRNIYSPLTNVMHMKMPDFALPFFLLTIVFNRRREEIASPHPHLPSVLPGMRGCSWSLLSTSADLAVRGQPLFHRCWGPVLQSGVLSLHWGCWGGAAPSHSRLPRALRGCCSDVLIPRW